MKVSFEVKTGSIDINSIWVYRATKSLLHFSIDTKQKYPEFACSGGTEFHFGVNDETLNKNGSDDYTRVKVIGIDDWFNDRSYTRMMHDTSRYGFDICISRHGKGKVVWWKGKE